MIQIVDQSDPEKLKFYCDRCGRTFVQSTRANLDLHAPVLGQDAVKLGIPPCQPLPVATPVAATAAPAKRRGRPPKAAIEPTPAPKARKRKPKVAPA